MVDAYANAGVDIAKNNALKEEIKRKVRETFNKNVVGDVGLFGGLFDVSEFKDFEHPILVASTDGVGTKLMVAKAMGRWDSVGKDLVGHCINDILVQGAKPLFFMDYIAGEKLERHITAQIVTGLAQACKEAGIVLLGGETAEMPGTYQRGEYDLAGTIIGVAEKKDIIDGSGIREGDVIIGLPSSGLHTNGYSLARKILFERAGYTPNTIVPELGHSVGDALLAVHRDYAKQILPLVPKRIIKGMAHITGGGFEENVPRVLPRGLGARINTHSWHIPALFKLIQSKGDVEKKEMYRVFNMGIGLVVIADKDDKDTLLNALDGSAVIGEVISGSGVSYA